MSHKIAIVCGSFHKNYVSEMLKAARKKAVELELEIIAEHWVPGSFEKPLAVQRYVQHEDVDGAVVLGIIEKGETAHGLVMGQSVTAALLDIQLTFDKPVGMGILGPEIEPHQIEQRLEPYATAAVEAVKSLLE